MAHVPSQGFTRSSLGRPLHGPTLAFRLEDELAALRREPGYREHGRAARTLAKYSETRLVLEAMRAGARFSPNGPSEQMTLHCLTGHVRVHLPDFHTLDVTGGGLCTLDRYMAVEVEAVEESGCLLTVAWPPEA
jgi:hypothetical protein